MDNFEGMEYDDATIVALEGSFNTEISGLSNATTKEAFARGLAVLEAYQQRPARFNAAVASAILRVALMRLPRPDFISAITIIPDTFVCNHFSHRK